MKKENKKSWELHIEATNEQFVTEELKLGPWTSYSMIHDPKHMAFVLARYKFCSKILSGKDKVLEVGCGDGFGAPIMAHEVGKLHCVDWEKRNIDGNKRRLSFLQNTTFEHLDITNKKTSEKFDGIFSIDVIEHLLPEDENDFIKNMVDSLYDSGVLIIGTPNESASIHATHRSDIQHINLKNAKTMKESLDKYFYNCFIFSMNDEVIHTGYYPMAHYLFAVATGIK